MSGSFWKLGNGFTTISNITTLLEKHSANVNNSDYDSSFDLGNSNTVKLTQLLDENELLQELSNNNALLLEYLRNFDILDELVELVINYRSVDDDNLANDSNLDVETDHDKDFNFAAEKNSSLDTAENTSSSSNNIEFEKFEEIDENIDGASTINEEQEQEQDKDDHETDENDHETDENDHDDSINDTNSLSSNNSFNELSDETEQEAATRRASIATEILSADIWSITDTLMENLLLIEKLWSILDLPSPLPIHLSNSFMKINEHLLDMKMDEMIQFILNQPKLVVRFMRHIDNPPLMDFLLKVISTDKPDTSTGVIDVLQQQRLIPALIEFLGPNIPSYIQSAAGDFVKAFVTISANSNTDNSTIGPNELTRELVGEPIINRMVELMLHGGTGLGNGVGIIIEIIRKNNSDYDIVPVLYITIDSHPPSPRDPIYLGTLVKVFSESIPRFTKMLERHNDKKLETPFGTIEPLGFERFKICELIAELLHCSNMSLLNDSKGWDVVKERDVERDRLKNLHRVAFQFNYPIDESEENENENHSSNHQDDIDNENRSETFEDEKEKKENEHEENDIMSENLNNLTIDENDTITSFNEDEYDDDNNNEMKLRKTPVVGDLLKISLSDTNIIITILKMFFKFPWNNFLHNVVFDIVQQVLNGSIDQGFNKYLCIDLFHKGSITKLIIEGQLKCDDYESSTGLRLGYMGHLTLIAEEVVKFIQLYPKGTISKFIDESSVIGDEWEQYVSETLYETREKYNAILGGSGSFEESELEDSIIDNNSSLDPHSENFVSYDYENADFEHDFLKDSDTIKAENESAELGKERYEDRDDDYDNDYLKDIDSINFEKERDIKTQYTPINNSNIIGNINDHEEDEEGDQFSRYMSQQITNDLPNKFGSSDEDEEEEDLVAWNYHYSKKNEPPNFSNISNLSNLGNLSNSGNDDDDDDDYVDPNDDGQSYTKTNHPLYDSNGELNDKFKQLDDPTVQSEKEDKEKEEFEKQLNNYIDPVSDDDDYDEDLGLMRSKSKGEMNWDDNEQNRILKLADFFN